MHLPLNRFIDASFFSFTIPGFWACRTVPNRLANSSAKFGVILFGNDV